MADLNFGPPPTRSPLPAILIAAGVLIAAAVAIFLLNPRKTAELSVADVKLYAVKVETKAIAAKMNVIGTLPHVDRDLYVIVHINLKDDLRLPLFIKGETLVLTAPDDTVLNAEAVPSSDVPNLTTTFPALAPLTSNILPYNSEVDRKQTADGTVLFHFPGLTEDNWNARKAATLTLDLLHQKSMTVAIPR